MRLVWAFLFLVHSIIGHLEYTEENESEEHEDYLNQWVVEIKGGKSHALTVAAEHGFTVERQFMNIPDHYHLVHLDVPHRAKRSASHHTKRLSEDKRIIFAEQQHAKRRVKRGRLYDRELAGEIIRSSRHLNDPQFIDQWYINDETRCEKCGMGVVKAWMHGVSGRNISVTILDDGLERNHPDLALNYDPLASYDFNDNDPDPMPRYEKTNENKHGTRCGGEIAMVANNGECGVGIAYNCRIGGVRMLDGKVTDRVEGDAIGFIKNVHISSASWGPNDDGKTMEGPGRTAMKGINESITLGREGKGSILVWAAGNGAGSGDNCNCDGYTSDYRTFSVSSASQHGLSPWYSEKCSSTLAATYSSGNAGEKKVVTADLHNKCTSQHTGTSAAAPFAAGIIALVLEKNQKLTWRDVQHLAVVTSRYEPLVDETGWYRNGVGLAVNHAFGFGLMDAYEMVALASEWENVAEQKTCLVSANTTVDSFPKEFTSGNTVEVEIHTDGCKGQDNEINYLESVRIFLTLETTKRGNIYAELESPSGTITALMLERSKDKSDKGFLRWPLMSVHTWYENPSGTWKFRVADRSSGGNEKYVLKDVVLELRGTREKPYGYDKIDRKKHAHLETYPTIIQQEVEEDPIEQLKHLFGDL